MAPAITEMTSTLEPIFSPPHAGRKGETRTPLECRCHLFILARAGDINISSKPD